MERFTPKVEPHPHMALYGEGCGERTITTLSTTTSAEGFESLDDEAVISTVVNIVSLRLIAVSPDLLSLFWMTRHRVGSGGTVNDWLRWREADSHFLSGTVILKKLTLPLTFERIVSMSALDERVERHVVEASRRSSGVS